MTDVAPPRVSSEVNCQRWTDVCTKLDTKGGSWMNSENASIRLCKIKKKYVNACSDLPGMLRRTLEGSFSVHGDCINATDISDQLLIGKQYLHNTQISTKTRYPLNTLGLAEFFTRVTEESHVDYEFCQSCNI